MELSLKVGKPGDKTTRESLCLLQFSSDPAMSQRFTLVRIQSMQSGLFLSQKQKVNERVADYAQNSSRLYQKAYPGYSRNRLWVKQCCFPARVRTSTRDSSQGDWNQRNL